MRDAPPCRWAFAWRTDDHNPLIRALTAPSPRASTAGVDSGNDDRLKQVARDPRQSESGRPREKAASRSCLE